MSFISADVMFKRTVEILQSEELVMAVTPPAPVIYHDLGKPFALWGPVKRPDFVIDERELPF